jgi:streptogramin lyase
MARRRGPRPSPIFLITIGLAIGPAQGARAAKITELTIPTPGSLPRGITTGPDGRVWFTENAKDKIGAVTPSGMFTEYDLPAGTGPNFIASAPKRMLVYTSDNHQLGVTAASNGATIEYAVGGEEILGIAAGQDGRIWLAQYNTAKIVGFHFLSNSPTTSATPIPTASSFPFGITVGPERWIWYTESGANKVGFCAPYNASLCTDYAIPTADSDPQMIALGPDGNLWFTEFSGNKIGRVTTGGVITEFPIPTIGASPFGIAAGPDGNLWFTEVYGNKIGRITTAGVITEYPVPTPGSQPYVICAGPDGRIWFTEQNAGKLGRVDVFMRGDVSGDGVVDVNDVFYAINFLFAGGPVPK